ncbi:MAG: hypothetical protein KDA21_02340 [Phycisphaerales bacterium]|nr:hypothetical protein [Phycisphaerales bacterium]
MTTSTKTPPPPAARPPVRTGGPSGAPNTLGAAGNSLDPMRILRVYWPWLTAAGVLGIVVGIGAYLALSFTMPKFASATTFHAKPQIVSGFDPLNMTAGDSKELPIFMETQVVQMTSDMILTKVVNEPEFKTTRLAKSFINDSTGLYDSAEALKAVRDIVNAKVVEDTQYMTLRVTTGMPKDECATICNIIAQVYLDNFKSASQADTRSKLRNAEARMSTLREELATIDRQMENLLQGSGITAFQQKDSLYQEEIRHLQPQIVVLRDEAAKAQEQLSLYEEMSKNSLVPETIRTEVERMAIVQQQDSAILQEKALLRALQEKYGDNHRDVKRRKSVIRALESERETLIQDQTRELFESTKEGLRTSISRYNASLSELMTRLNEAERKLQAITKALNEHENLEDDRTQKNTEIAELTSKIETLRGILDGPLRVSQMAPAPIPDQKAFPRLVPLVAVSTFLIGGLVGGFIVLREVQEQRIRTPQDVSALPRTRVVGIVPELSMDPSNPERFETASRDRPQGVIAESVRQIRTDVLRECRKAGHKTLLFVGGMPGSGTTSLVTNLAMNSAATDLRVLVVDANFRRPALHKTLGCKAGPGLGDVLTGKAGFEQVVQTTDVQGLDVIAAGEPENRIFERFTTAAMADFVRTAREKYDLVLFDSAPAVVAGDALAVASHVDASVLVVRAYSEKRGLVSRLRNQFGDTKAEFLGVIVNGVRASAGGYFKRNFKAAHEYQKSAVSESAVGRKRKKGGNSGGDNA